MDQNTKKPQRRYKEKFMDLGYIFNIITIIALIALPAIGITMGQSRAAIRAIIAIDTQPAARGSIMKMVILGMALMETAGVLGVAFAVMLILDLFSPTNATTTASGLAWLGIACALGIPGMATGITSAWPTREACNAVARQPFFSSKILNVLLLSLTLLQTPVVLGFIMAWLIKSQAVGITDILDGIRLLSAGFVVGVGSIGPLIGIGHFARQSVNGLGLNRDAYPQLFAFTFISEAIIETPLLFAFVVGLILLYASNESHDAFVRGTIYISAAACTGIAAIMPSISSGKVASVASREIALTPERYSAIARASMLVQALLDTFIVYATLVSLMMIFMVK